MLVPTERHADVAEQVITERPWLAGNLLHDAHPAILMREHGIRRICTRDTGFHRFAFLEVGGPSLTSEAFRADPISVRVPPSVVVEVQAKLPALLGIDDA